MTTAREKHCFNDVLHGPARVGAHFAARDPETSPPLQSNDRQMGKGVGRINGTIIVDLDPPGGGFVHEGFLPTANILLAVGVDASIHEGQLIVAC